MHSAVDKLMSATEIISEGPEGIILESVLEGYAEYYSADLAEKVVRGQTENILKGPLQRWSWHIWLYAGFRAEVPY